MGLGRLFRRRFWDEERARELEAHLQHETDDNIARGMSPDEAPLRRAAQARQPGADPRGDPPHEQRRDPRDTLWQDVRYGLRQLAGDRGFTTVAVLTLGLGIGSVTVMYSVIHNVLLDPFPYAHSSRMVDVMVRDMDQPDSVFRGGLIPDEFLDFQEQSRSFEAVIGTNTEPMVLRTPERAEPVSIAWGTPNMFAFLGVAPLLGRNFGETDGQPGAPPVAVLSHEAWQRLFGGDASVVGRTIILNEAPYSVIGVMPPRFTWHVADAWVPRALQRGATAPAPDQRWFQAHLRSGTSEEQAEAELQVIAERRAIEHPKDYPKRFRIDVITVIDWVVGRFRGVLYSLFGAVGLLMLIACVNVANMLLARASVREREITIRAALGASRGRIVRQLLVESALLALAGGAAGCAIAWGLLQALLQFLPRQGVAYEVEISLDRPVLLFSLAVSALASLVFGLMPALHGVPPRPRGRAEAGRPRDLRGLPAARAARRPGDRRGRAVARVADRRLAADPQLRADDARRPGNGRGGSAALRRAVRGERSAYAAQQQQAVSRALERVIALPGVIAAAEATGLPTDGFRSDIEVPGRPSAERRRMRYQLCSQGYLRTFGVRLVRGRDFTEDDIAGARRVAIVNETLAATHFPGEDPIGRTIVVAGLGHCPIRSPSRCSRSSASRATRATAACAAIPSPRHSCPRPPAASAGGRSRPKWPRIRGFRSSRSGARSGHSTPASRSRKPSCSTRCCASATTRSLASA